MTLPKRTPRLAALLALLAPFSLAAACAADDGDLLTNRGGKAGSSAGASGNTSTGGTSQGGAAGSGEASAGSAGDTSGGSAGASAGADAGAGASAAGNAGAGGDAAAGGSDAAGASGNEAAAGSGGSLPPPVCGNAAVEEGEECDDGNDLPGDGCFECKISFCGNQQLDDGEPCDGTDLAGQTCETASGNPKLVGKLGCSPSCAFDYAECFESCESQSQEATLKKKPVDIIFVIDNSGSMSNEIKAVQNNINKSFSQIIGQSGLDYRVIMISAHGSYSSFKICVASPLSGTTCSPIPKQPALTDQFKQHSTTISSKDSLTKVLASYAAADPFKLAPNGWSTWLRPEAAKVFVEITDDNQDSKQSAASFDAALLKLSSTQFGTAQKRNYVFHSIVGVAAKAIETEAYEADEPIVTAKCKTAENTGSVYQDLSKLTGGLRFPVCASTGYDAVFQRIAQGIIEGSKIECSFPVPDNASIDQTTIQVEYTPGTGGPAQVFDLVKDVASCGPSRVYIEQGTVKLCPDACTLVQADASAKLGVLWGCGFIKD
jgi:cysteine-rich repeat protein